MYRKSKNDILQKMNFWGNQKLAKKSNNEV